MSEPLLNEIRSTRPVAPEALRERVRAIAAQEPAREPFLARFEWRRLVLVAPAMLVVALVAAGVIGLSRDSERIVSPGATTVEGTFGKTEAADDSSATSPPALGAPSVGGGVAPSPGRAQRYEAELRLRVDDVEALSSATKRAQQVALSLGGHVASLQYDAPAEGIGGAQITLRVPTARVQSAMAQLSQLGTILGQRYGIEDLQVQVDALQAQIEQTQRRIAGILEQLETATLSAGERAVLRTRLANAREELSGLREGLRGTNAEARTATIHLSLTTEEIAAATEDVSRLDDVKDVLAWEAIALLYVLVVAGPFVLLGLIVWLALRLRRRRDEARLLAK